MSLPAVRKAYADGPFGQIHYRHAGNPQSGPALLCLHMSPKSSRLFSKVLPYLARHRYCIAPDNPGHGESDLPPAEPPVTVEDFATSAATLLRHLGVEECDLLGHHTGAMVAAELASRGRPRVRSVVSLSAPVFTDAEIAALHGEYAPIPIDEAGTRFRRMWQRVLDNRGPGMTLEMAAASFAENLRAGEHYEWGHRAAFNYAARYRDVLAGLEQAVLVINPADDCEEASRRADSLMMNGQRIDKPEWGHGFLSAYPEQAAALVNDFLDRQNA